MIRVRIWMTAGEAAQKLGCSPAIVHRLADAGEITSLKLPGFRPRRFKAADVERVLSESTSPATAPARETATACAN